ncbi:MAG: outer membrane beta-barrel protein [Deltaproteobacteria bacterium]|nr:MAG: outer membrane beta-barrel protein [Deltaproteobacteria bacterium]
MKKLLVVFSGIALIMGITISQAKAQSPTEAQSPAESEPPAETQPPAEATPPTQSETTVKAETPAKKGPLTKATRIGLSGAGYDWFSLSDDGEEGSVSIFSIGSVGLGTSIGGGAGLIIGHCANENTETGLMFNFARLNLEDYETMTNMKFVFYLNYNHSTSDRVVVFPEILFGYTITELEIESPFGNASTTMSGFLLGAGYGLKYFIFENVSFDLTLNYIYGILDVEDEDVTSSEMLLRTGISLYFIKQ